MIAPDTNLLIYAYDENSPFYARANVYLENLLNGDEPVGLPVLCVHGFVRISSSAAFSRAGMSLEDAVRIVDEWLLQPHVSILNPGALHWQILKDICGQVSPSSRVFPDAAIAAIAVEHGAVIHSNDRDFARFPGVRWVNPLEP